MDIPVEKNIWHKIFDYNAIRGDLYVSVRNVPKYVRLSSCNGRCGAAIFTTIKNTATVFLAKSVKKSVCVFVNFNMRCTTIGNISFSTGKITPTTLLS